MSGFDRIPVLMRAAEEAASGGIAKIGDPTLTLWVETWDHGIPGFRPVEGWEHGELRVSLFFNSYACCIHKRADAYHALTLEQFAQVVEFYIARADNKNPEPPVTPLPDTWAYLTARRGG